VLDIIIVSLGLATNAKGLTRLRSKRKPKNASHRMLPGSVGKCEGMNPHIPKATPTLGDGIPMDYEFLKGNCKGQNSMARRVPYIIGNLLERRCLKWVCITHLDI
jgi:hypothetical protein